MAYTKFCLTFTESILFPILKSFWKVRARLPFCNEAFPTVYEKVTRKVSAWFGLEKGLMLDRGDKKFLIFHYDQVSRAGRRGEKAVPAADGKKNHVACPICRWLFFVIVFVSWTKYVWKNVTYEHKNFIDDQLIIARSLWPMITIIYALHVSMMYFILYEICQIDYPEKMRPKESLCVDVSSEIFHRIWIAS